MLLEGFETGSELHETISLISAHRIVPLSTMLLGPVFLYAIIGWIISGLLERYYATVQGFIGLGFITCMMAYEQDQRKTCRASSASRRDAAPESRIHRETLNR